MKKILFVDDEQQILKSLKRIFFRLEYKCFYANSGDEALEIMSREKIHMIITDIRMPKMDGYSLLEKVKKIHPLIIRVALSGYTDKAKIYNALENNLVKLYLFKPWENEELTEIIKKLFKTSDALNNKGLVRLINDIDNLPSLPKLYKEINNLIENQEDVDLIAKRIEEDPSICSKILRISNAAFHRKKTGSIKEAIMFIGLANVKNIVLADELICSNNGKCNHFKKLQKHSIITNVLTQSIYEEILDKKIPNLNATAGLLHEIGKVVFFNCFRKEYKDFLDNIEKNLDNDIIEAEKKILGYSHNEIGALLLEWWGLPLGIVESALYYGDPLNENIINKELVSVISLASYYSKKLLDYSDNEIKIQNEVFEYLNINPDIFEEWINSIDRDYFNLM